MSWHCTGLAAVVKTVRCIIILCIQDQGTYARHTTLRHHRRILRVEAVALHPNEACQRCGGFIGWASQHCCSRSPPQCPPRNSRTRSDHCRRRSHQARFGCRTRATPSAAAPSTAPPARRSRPWPPALHIWGCTARAPSIYELDHHERSGFILCRSIGRYLHWCTGRTNILAHAVVPRFNFSANPIHWVGGGGGRGVYRA